MINGDISEVIMTTEPATSLEEYRALHSLGRVSETKARVILHYLSQIGEAAKSVRLPMPPSELGSVPVFDAMLLAALLRLSRPRRVLEFGTYLGYSTRVLLENSDDFCRIVSIDLPHGSSIGEPSLSVSELELHASAEINDEYLRELQFHEGPRYLSGIDQVDSDRVKLVKSDSRKLNRGYLTAEAGGPFDLIFIDGGHDRETIRSDTELAIECASRHGLIVWHDYRSSIHRDVTSYLDEIATQFAIRFVSGSLVAFCFLGEDPLMTSGVN